MNRKDLERRLRVIEDRMIHLEIDIDFLGTRHRVGSDWEPYVPPMPLQLDHEPVAIERHRETGKLRGTFSGQYPIGADLRFA